MLHAAFLTLRPRRSMAALLLSSALGALAPACAHAQSIDLSHGGQITVTAQGGFDWDQNQKKVTAYEQAKAVRGDVTVTADKLIAYYRKKQPEPGSTANTAPNAAPPAATTTPADKAADGTSAGPDSSGSNEIFRLEAIGHVHIYTQTDQAWGDKAVYDMDQAVLVMHGNAMKLTTPQDVLTARDSMEYYSQLRISIGRGNATVTTNDGRQIRADVLVGYSAPPDKTQQPATKTDTAQQDKKDTKGDPLSGGSGKLEKVNAFGHVWVRTQTETVTGERGVYVPDTGIARIVGNVHITRGPNQIQGAAAIINMHTGLATMTENPGSRVSGVVVPNNSDGSDRK
ncbi:LptA/OstA family protein [Acetobacter orientalis]|uniref:Organic solvent tolerance protein n=1 Tax=Acetobacter orientalis TaxID=146474 RepID=A0A2Z5ZGD8_9PROT|nr:organic solvent tolerance protein [Acetobacter orientalis]GAN65455.1 hypothetical protein Abor_010_018 [Acetobacter orientalis]GBR18959.1 hypothetical protein AA0481_1755 [Acetobacter orientalis NRIC 0481]GEL61029.1 hypothetical protein AOR02nite_08710 [Acetobacter orientalis]